ncbi:related to NADH-ubiquinone oxidoreductase [Cephalotrichum gorgonifer]|uniref:Related to NADH-ubiquinone oxidoreductase n=1 Tax=Cephalotrichum gorgonifer TaxID=2041049 RepID=A0AAE8N3L8_9PEZI|nr:related to NADH-ubiquinone oxidoreductase [Cephalotrichum gorgonifer]
MRSSLRLLARYLEPGTTTGLTGLLTHATPRSTLLSLYRSTLEKLEKLPATSLYRQSVEALTKHRLSAVEGIVPAGYQEWESKARKVLAENPGKFTLVGGDDVSAPGMRTLHIDGKTYVTPERRHKSDIRTEEWDGETDEGAVPEGHRSAQEKEEMVRQAKANALKDTSSVALEDEPLLTAEQIGELEGVIGAGLIEEVIQVAQGELKLVDTMQRDQVWEPLEEKPVEGQWSYFDRGN